MRHRHEDVAPEYWDGRPVWALRFRGRSYTRRGMIVYGDNALVLDGTGAMRSEERFADYLARQMRASTFQHRRSLFLRGMR